MGDAAGNTNTLSYKSLASSCADVIAKAEFGGWNRFISIEYWKRKKSVETSLTSLFEIPETPRGSFKFTVTDRDLSHCNKVKELPIAKALETLRNKIFEIDSDDTVNDIRKNTRISTVPRIDKNLKTSFSKAHRRYGTDLDEFFASAHNRHSELKRQFHTEYEELRKLITGHNKYSTEIKSKCKELGKQGVDQNGEEVKQLEKLFGDAISNVSKIGHSSTSLEHIAEHFNKFRLTLLEDLLSHNIPETEIESGLESQICAQRTEED